MKKLVMHEAFTDESNSVIKIEEFLDYIKNLSFEEQSANLVEFLRLSDMQNKEHLKEIKDYMNYMEKRKFSNKEKNRVVESKKIKFDSKKYYNDEIKKYQKDIEVAIKLNFDEFKEFVETYKNCNDFLMLGIIREITTYNRFADEAYLNNERETIEEIKMIVIDLQEKLNYLKKQNQLVVASDEKKNCRIVFLETSSNRSYFTEDIKKFNEHFSSFAKLYLSLLHATPRRLRAFTSCADLQGLLEVRDIDRGTRILFDRLNENTYIILDAFIKKVDNSSGYRNQLENRYKYYLQQKQHILNHLNDEVYCLRQEKYLEEANAMLGLDIGSSEIGGKSL